MKGAARASDPSPEPATASPRSVKAECHTSRGSTSRKQATRSRSPTAVPEPGTPGNSRDANTRACATPASLLCINAGSLVSSSQLARSSREAAFRRARKHSRKVQFLKFALPSAAILIAGSFADLTTGLACRHCPQYVFARTDFARMRARIRRSPSRRTHPYATSEQLRVVLTRHTRPQACSHRNMVFLGFVPVVAAADAASSADKAVADRLSLL